MFPLILTFDINQILETFLEEERKGRVYKQEKKGKEKEDKKKEARKEEKEANWIKRKQA